MSELALHKHASLWHIENRERARTEVERHGSRPVLGGWPTLKGTQEKKMADAVREVDATLRHPQVQVSIKTDTHGVVCARYRIPDKHEEGVIGVVHTGRGVMYSNNRLEHLMNADGEYREFNDSLLEEVAQIRARKATRDASQETSS